MQGMIPLKMRMKKAQAAGLVATILLLIILYIVFLPPEDREDLLGDEKESHPFSDNGEKETLILLKESPGTLSFIEDNDADKDIPNIFLLESTSAKELEKFNPFIIRNGWLDKKIKTLNFKIDDLSNTDNILLSFNALKHKGTLNVKLNGNDIYEQEITSFNAEPINLKKGVLKNDNVLEFSVSSVGAKFWTTNEYSFENLAITADITDKSRQKSKNTFTLTDVEYQNLKKATLKFIPYCSSEKAVGLLDVEINRNIIYSSIPVCEDPVNQEFSIDLVNEGENNIIFNSHKGSYSVEQIKVDLPLKESKTVAYFFEINKTDFDEIENATANVTLFLDFIDDGENKRADISVNGHKTQLDQDEKEYSRVINNWVEEDNNYLEIKPRTILNIVELRVELEHKN